MRVRVTVTIDVDPADWAEAYGFDPDDRALIRQDVKSDMYEAVVGHFVRVGIPATVREV